MRFLGLFIMRNLVKPETAGVISTLRLAQLRTVMVTGEMSSLASLALLKAISI